MRTIRDMSREEVLALSHEQIEEETRRVLALEGVPQLPPSPQQPAPVDAQPDMRAWRIRCDLIFDDKDVAEAVVAHLNKQPRKETYFLEKGHYVYSGPQGLKDCDDDLETSPARYWTPEQYDRNRVAIEAHKEAKELYDAKKTSYEEVQKQQEDVRGEVSQIIARANNEKYDEDVFRSTLEEYLRIAEEDRDVAWKFLVRAHPKYDTSKWREIGGYNYDPIRLDPDPEVNS